MNRMKWICGALCLALLLNVATAEVLPPEAAEIWLGEDAEMTAPGDAALPDYLTVIEAEAFEGDLSLTSVTLPEGCEAIQSRAFADSGLTDIYIPNSVTDIADDAFDGCAETLAVRGWEDSDARYFCDSHQITFINADASADPRPEWNAYDAMIADIKSTTDYTAREALMHRAEDMLMDTGAIVPLYYYNDTYLQRGGVTGVYANLYGYKYFQYATVKDSDTLRLCLASEPYTLDPALNSSVDGACLALAAFGGLYRYDADGQLVPDFATGYTLSADGRTYTFTMRDGLKWSDGSALNATDFAYSWKRAASTATGADYGYMFDIIQGYPNDLAVTASADGKQLTVTLKSPCAYMLDLMAFPAFCAVQKACVEASAGWADRPGFVCSGPFTLTEWAHDDYMVYTRNPNYWDAASVKLNHLNFTLSEDEYEMFDAYMDGALDFIDTFPGDADIPQNDLHVIDNLGTYYVNFNIQSPLFEGKTARQAAAMRRAISLLIDRTAFVTDEQKPANSFIPAGMADGHGGVFKRSDSAYTYPVNASFNGVSLPGYFGLESDIDKAIALLKQAGYRFENGRLSERTPISIKYVTNQTAGHLRIAERMRQNLAEIGIEMSIHAMSWPDFLNERASGDYDLARNGWVADFNDPINMLEMWITDSGNNDAQFGR